MTDTPHDKSLARLGQQLEEARIRLGLTQADVSGRTAIHRTRITRIERGRTNSTAETLITLGDAVGLSLIFVPAERVKEVEVLVADRRKEPASTAGAGDVYRDVFVGGGGGGEAKEK